MLVGLRLEVEENMPDYREIRQLTVSSTCQNSWCVGGELSDSVLDESEVRAFWALELVHAGMGCIQSMTRKAVKAG